MIYIIALYATERFHFYFYYLFQDHEDNFPFALEHTPKIFSTILLYSIWKDMQI